MFHVTQSKIQKIGSQGLSTQEEPLKKNLQSSLANELQELSVKFRKDQKDYLQSILINYPIHSIFFRTESSTTKENRICAYF